MRRNRIQAMACAVMTVVLAAGCVSGDGENTEHISREEGKYEDFITVDVYDEFANYQGVQSGWFAKVVKDRFNMELNMIAPNVTGGGDTMLHTRSATGNLGDLIIINTANGKFNKLVDSGLMLDCTEYMKDKDVMNTYGQAVSKTNELVEREGIYGFPNSVSMQAATKPSEGPEPTYGPYIRWDYYKKLGYPQMDDLSDFLDVLEQMQELARREEKAGDIYAISLFKDWDYNMMNNAKQIACMYGYDEQGFVLSRADGSDYQNIIEKDSFYVQMLRFLNVANARGLIDPDSESQNYDAWLSKYQKGKVLYSPWSWVGDSTYNNAENKADGKGFKMAGVKDMQILSFGCWPEGDSTQIIGIGSGAADPERLADFIDWLYSPEGMEMNGQANGAAGPEGLTWERNEDGRPALTEFGRQALPNNPVPVPEEYGGGSWRAGISALNFRAVNLTESDPNTGEPYDYQCWGSSMNGNETALDIDWSERMDANTTMEYLQKNHMLLTAPGANYSTPAEDVNITTVREQCRKTVIDYSWRMVFCAGGSEFDALLRELQDTSRGLGYDRIYEVDLENAKAQAAAREASAEAYPLSEK